MRTGFQAAGIAGLAAFAIGVVAPARAAYIYDFTSSAGE
jgi:hypothetical protein